MKDIKIYFFKKRLAKLMVGPSTLRGQKAGSTEKAIKFSEKYHMAT